MKKKSYIQRLGLDLKRNYFKYLIVLPVLIVLILFAYKPMYGLVIAFQRYRPSAGISGSQWVGFNNFVRFFNDPYFFRLLKNTLTISFLSIVIVFPAPVLLALLLNEVRNEKFKRLVQTITYLPHFISLVVVCGMLKQFAVSNGVLNDIIVFFGGERSALFSDPDNFYALYIGSEIWQGVGWGSIIYLAALSSIDQAQYEAAKIDGAGRIRTMISITLPGLLPTVITLLILQLGNILNVGYEKILLLYEPLTYDVADVISTYVYRKGLLGNADFSYSTAVGLFNSVVNVIFLVIANKLSKKAGQSGLF